MGPCTRAAPPTASMTSEGEATVGWCEARTEAGRLHVIVSGAEISLGLG